MSAMSAAVLPGGRPFVKRILFAVFPAARKNVRCPNLLSLLLLVFCSSFRAASVNLPALRPPFWWAVPFQAVGNVLTKYGFLLLLGARRYRAAPYRVTPLYVMRSLS
jgi:hypothetical protein